MNGTSFENLMKGMQQRQQELAVKEWELRVQGIELEVERKKLDAAEAKHWMRLNGEFHAARLAAQASQKAYWDELRKKKIAPNSV